MHNSFESLLLVAGVALDRLDQIRDQVVATLGLHLDLATGIVNPVAFRNKAVVDGKRPQDEQDDDPEDDPPSHIK